MSEPLQPVIEPTNLAANSSEANAALAKLRAAHPQEYLRLATGLLNEIREECRAKESFYRCRDQLELAMRFDLASKAGLSWGNALQIAFAYERDEAIRHQIDQEIAEAQPDASQNKGFGTKNL